MARSRAAEKFELVAGAAEGFSEKFENSLVRCGIDGRGGDFDLQLVPDRACDLVARGARLDFQGNANAVGSLLKISDHQAEDSVCQLKRHGCAFLRNTPKLDRVCNWH